MTNQFDTEQYEVGSVFQDMEIISKTSKKDKQGKSRIIYTLRCKKCGRIKEKRKSYIDQGVGMSHRSCSEQIRPKDNNYKRFQRIWCAMRTRTTNEKQKSWKHYHNISSDHYKDFVDFYDDMFKSYLEHVKKYGDKDTTLDRINPYGDYEPSNIRWATKREQNQSKNKRGFKQYMAISPNQEVFYFDNQTEFALEHGLLKSKISLCLNGKRKHHKGWKFSWK